MIIIKNDKDLELAINRCYELRNSEAITDDYIEMLELAEQIEQYENKHYKISEPKTNELKHYIKQNKRNE